MTGKQFIYFFTVIFCAMASWGAGKSAAPGDYQTTQLPELTISPSDSVTILENDPLILQLVVQNPGPAPYIFSMTPAIENASLDSSGVFRFTPNFVQDGTYSVSFSADDGFVNLVKDATITVQDNNRVPGIEISFDGTLEVFENTVNEFSVIGSDPDVDNTLRYSVSPLIENLTLDPVTGIGRFEPDFTQSGLYTVEFSVSDGITAVTAQREIRVRNVNRRPEIITNPKDSVDVFPGETVNILAVGSDPDNDELTLNVANPLSSAVFNPDTGLFTFTPTLEQTKQTFIITFIVSDGLAIDTKDITINILPNADPFWDFDNNSLEGWEPVNHLRNVISNNGSLFGESTGIDPILINDDVRIDTFSQRELVFRANKNEGTPYSFFFFTSDGGFFGPLEVPVRGIAQTITYSVDFKSLFPSPKIITGIRLDPGSAGNLFIFDFIGVAKSGIPTRTPTMNPSFTATPTPTRTPFPTFTPLPTSTPTPTLDVTPTPTLTPTPTETPTPTIDPNATPTPTPTLTPTPTATFTPTVPPTPTPEVETFNFNFDLHGSFEANFDIFAPAGYTRADAALVGVESSELFSGNGVRIEAGPGEGLFIQTFETLQTEGHLIEMGVSYRSDNDNAQLALVGFNAPVDGQLAYHRVIGDAIASGNERQFRLFYAPPNDLLVLGFQLVNPPDADELVSVIIDNLFARPVFDEGGTKVQLNPDGTFDNGVDGLTTNIGGLRGAVQLTDRGEGNRGLRLSAEPQQIGANAVVWAGSAEENLPATFLAKTEAIRLIGQGGTVAQAISNDFHSLVLLQNGETVPSTGDLRPFRLGGNLSMTNPNLRPFILFQNAAGPDLNSILIDNMELRRIDGP